MRESYNSKERYLVVNNHFRTLTSMPTDQAVSTISTHSTQLLALHLKYTRTNDSQHNCIRKDMIYLVRRMSQRSKLSILKRMRKIIRVIRKSCLSLVKMRRLRKTNSLKRRKKGKWKTGRLRRFRSNLNMIPFPHSNYRTLFLLLFLSHAIQRVEFTTMRKTKKNKKKRNQSKKKKRR